MIKARPLSNTHPYHRCRSHRSLFCYHRMGIVLVDIVRWSLSLLLSSCDDGHRGRSREVVIVTAPKVVVWPSSGGKERAGRWRGEKREQETGPGSGASQSGWKERTREG